MIRKLIFVLLTLSIIQMPSYEIELITTEEEKIELNESFNRGTLNDILVDALKGNRASSFLVGYFIMTGRSGGAIDMEMAYKYFSLAASLGFPMAFKELMIRATEENNLVLALVYMNLLVANGHSEFMEKYHSYRPLIISTFGKKVMRTIELIAQKKQMIISENIEKNKANHSLTTMKSITNEDYLYSDEYYLNEAQ